MGDIDQFARFQAAEEEVEVPDILVYWAAQFTNPCWSPLAHMALEIHSIVAMSAEVERALSRYVIIYYPKKAEIQALLIIILACIWW